jgi:ribosome-associated protein
LVHHASIITAIHYSQSLKLLSYRASVVSKAKSIKNMQENDVEQEFISKTKRKAEADAQQMVGKKLIALTKDQINKLNLEERLHDAVMEAKRLTANGAIRRQLQYIGRLMRDTDIEPIEEQLARWEGKNSEENARFHLLERWRDRLIEEAPEPQSDALQEFLATYPNADVQLIRTLCRNAHKERGNNKPPKSTRELFKLLRETTEAAQQQIDQN